MGLSAFEVRRTSLPDFSLMADGWNAAHAPEEKEKMSREEVMALREEVFGDG